MPRGRFPGSRRRMLGSPFPNITSPAFSKLPVLHWAVTMKPLPASSAHIYNPRVTAKNHSRAGKGLSNDNETAQTQAKVLTTS